MAITSTNAFINALKTALSSSSSLLESGEYNFITLQTLNELGWELPIKDAKKEFWCIQRGKRHAFDLLRTQAAHKFRYKQISLHQRFDHYDSLVKTLDEEFKEAMKTDPIFADSATTAGVFGIYVNNGFVYDQYGNDISKQLYDSDIDNEGYRERVI